MRAVTVPVSTTTGVAGFVFPGDRVDMVLTQEVAGGGDGPPSRFPRRSSATCACSPPTSASTARTRKARPSSRPSPPSRWKPRRAWPRRSPSPRSLGTLSLALRSIADNTAELERAVAAGEVKVPGRHQPDRRAPDAAGGRQSSGGQQHDLRHRRRRVALPAPQRPGRDSVDADQAGDPVPSSHAMPRGHWRIGADVGPARSSASLAAIMSPSFRWELAKMTSISIRRRARLGTALAALALSLGTVAVATPAAAPAAAPAPTVPRRRSAVGRRRPAGPPAAPMTRRVDVQPGRSPTSRSLVDPDQRVRQGSRRSNGHRHRQPRPRRLCAPTSASARTCRRSAKCCTWRCRKRTSR